MSKKHVRSATKSIPIPAQISAPAPLLLDLGAGKNKRAGYLGVDARDFEGVDRVVNLAKPWPWKDDSVDGANASHVIEHFNAAERIHFVNELHRVLKPGAKCDFAVPHWCSNRAYGDLTHQWPPVSEMWFFYLLRSWREVNAPHNDFYTCDFDVQYGYSLHPHLMSRNQEYQAHATTFWKEAAQDIIGTMTKRAA